MAAIDKLRNMNNWYDNQHETMTRKIQSVRDAERIYDYCIKHDVGFADTMEFEHPKHYDKLCERLKYTI